LHAIDFGRMVVTIPTALNYRLTQMSVSFRLAPAAEVCGQSIASQEDSLR